MSCLREEQRGGTDCRRNEVVIFVLRKHADFQGVAKHGVFVRGRCLLLQVCAVDVDREFVCRHAVSGDYHENQEEPGGSEEAQYPIFYGITAGRKVSNAVNRNKVKRRIRVLVREGLRFYVKGHRLGHIERRIFTLSKKTMVGMFPKKRTPCRANCGRFFPQLQQTDFEEFCKKSDERGTVRGLAFVFIATQFTPQTQWNGLREDFQKIVNDGTRMLMRRQ
ncbi:MAG: ribonuclease P protein component [Holosporales bacterium]|nr:ribonuclease P protein component [Holosporales bacterium]